jgi:hypothetical protein
MHRSRTKSSNIQIICYQRGWILEAIAWQLQAELQSTNRYGAVSIAFGQPTEGFQIYIHLIFMWAKPVEGAINWLYVTHIDQWWKAAKLVSLASQISGFIVMSNQTKNVVDRYIPGHNVIVKPPTSIHFVPKDKVVHKITVGLFFNIYNDSRKGNRFIRELLAFCAANKELVDVIMYGKGFDRVTPAELAHIAHDDSEFELETYKRYLSKCDYVVYFGADEGAFSILDAATLGIPVIAVAQGYHLDIDLPRASLLVNSPKAVLASVKALVEARKARRANDERLLALSKPPQLLKSFTYLRRLYFASRVPFVHNAFLSGRIYILGFLRIFAGMLIGKRLF